MTELTAQQVYDYMQDGGRTRYQGLLKLHGCDILAQKRVGDYQGDIIFAVKHEDRYGLVVVGYGSCSGCDALKAVRPWKADADVSDYEDMASLANRIFSEIMWFDKKPELVNKIDSKDWEGSFVSYYMTEDGEGGYEEINEFRREVENGD